MRRALVVLAALASCVDVRPLTVPDGCQPLEGELSCTLPYPSNFFFDGKVVALKGAAKPVSSKGVDADLVTPLAADGFSRQPTLACMLPDAVVADGLPNIEDDASISMTAGRSPTLVIDAETGELLPHYVDLDPAADDPAQVVIAIRPIVQLKPAHRYVVALYGVKNARGELAAPAEGFRRVRDQDTSRDPSLAPIAARYEGDVFAVIAKQGVARKDLQLAWDFTTESQSWPEHDMLDVRALVQTWLDQNPAPAVTVTNVATNPYPEYAREITGTLTVPLYLDHPETGGVLFRDSSGKIAQNGTATVPFKIVVPTTATSQWTPARALAFGHGFFGGTDELDGQEARTLLSTLRVVGFGIDWWGMSKDDLGTVVGLISQTPADTWKFVERVYQAMANWMVMTRAIKTSLATQPSLALVRGRRLYDPTHVFYFGASMGHILGGVMSAINPDIERAALEVGGAGWEHMMPRATPFSGFNFFIKSAMGTEVGTQTVEAMFATALDRIDPATYAPYLIGSHLPGNPDRRVILQAGIGDAEVPNVATYFHARALGLSMVSPTPESAWGIPLVSAGDVTSALTMWDFGISPDTYREAKPPPDNPVHNGLRNVPTAMQQIDAFLRTNGTVIDPCAGACEAY
jgi:hypothetical protein